MDRQTGRSRVGQRYRKINRHTDRWTGKEWTDGLAENEQMERQTDR